MRNRLLNSYQEAITELFIPQNYHSPQRKDKILGQLHVVVIYKNVTNSAFLVGGSYISINVASTVVWPLNFILIKRLDIL